MSERDDNSQQQFEQDQEQEFTFTRRTKMNTNENGLENLAMLLKAAEESKQKVIAKYGLRTAEIAAMLGLSKLYAEEIGQHDISLAVKLADLFADMFDAMGIDADKVIECSNEIEKMAEECYKAQQAPEQQNELVEKQAYAKKLADELLTRMQAQGGVQ